MGTTLRATHGTSLLDRPRFRFAAAIAIVAALMVVGSAGSIAVAMHLGG